MRLEFTARRAAFLLVFLIVGGSFIWWYRQRPFYLLFQAHREMGKEDQAETIARYQKLLAGKNLSKEDEIRYRTELARYYLRVSYETGNEAIGYTNDLYRIEFDYYYQLPHYSAQPKTKFDGFEAVESPALASVKKQCDAILELDPKNAYAHFLLGYQLMRRKQYKYAADEFKLSADFDPRDPRPLEGMARVRLLEEKPAEARELCLKALAVNADFQDARLTLINAYNMAGEFENAIEQFDKLSPETRSNPMVQGQRALLLAEQNFWKEAFAEIENADRAGGANGIVKIYYGQIQMKAGQYEEASGQFSQAATLLSRYFQPLFLQAEAMAARGHCGEVERIAQMATGYWPRSTDAHVLAARSAVCRGEDAQALAALDEALRLDSRAIDAIRLKAQILLDKEQFDNVGSLIRPLLDKPLYRSEGYVYLALSLLGQGRLGLAEETLETAIQSDNRNAKALATLGWIRFMKSDVAGALRAFENAMNLNPYDAVIAGSKHWCDGQSGKPGLARIGLQNLINKDPQNALLWRLLGDIQRKESDLTDAVQSYQTCLGLRPYLLRAHLGLISTYWEQGQHSAAKAAVGEAVKVNSKSKEIQQWKTKTRA